MLTPIDSLPSVTRADLCDWLAESGPDFDHDPAMVRDNLLGLDRPPMLDLGEVPLASLSGVENRPVSAVAVRLYAAMLDEGCECPPVLIANGALIEGGHRVHAHLMVGRDTIPAVDVSPLLSMDWGRWLSDPDFYPFEDPDRRVWPPKPHSAITSECTALATMNSETLTRR